jgi:Zn-dependent oligopeptidase
MLENWCWESSVLSLMSSHYETKEHLPSALIDKIIQRYGYVLSVRRPSSFHDCSRYVNVGLFYLRQLFFANFDMKVHTDKSKFI